MLERRTKGNRRWDLDNGYPMKDSDGLAVIANRRRISDRRLHNTTLEERMMMFAEMPPLDPDW